MVSHHVIALASGKSIMYLQRMAQVEVYKIDPKTVANKTDELVLTGDEAHHLSRVRRSRIGDAVILIDGLGSAYAAIVTRIEKREVGLKLDREFSNWNEPEVKVNLGIGILKGDKWLQAIDLATQLGVSIIHPLETAHSIGGYSSNRAERSNRRALESSKQTGRGLVPAILPMKLLEQFCIEEGKASIKLFGSQTGDTFPSVDKGELVTACIGPEGGFSKDEEKLLLAYGFKPVRLGSRRLRTETAVAALMSGIVSQVD